MMTRFLLIIVSVLLLANIIQYCGSSMKNQTIEIQQQQLECFKSCK